MINSLASISFNNEEKAKKSVVIAATAVIFISNITFANNSLKIAGLELEVSQAKTLAALQLILLVTLVALLFAFLERLPIRLSRLIRYHDEQRWWPPIQKDIDQFHRDMSGRNEEDFRPDPDWDDLAYSERYERKQRRKRLAGLTRPIVLFTRTIANYIWPAGLAYVAWFNPDLIFLLK